MGSALFRRLRPVLTLVLFALALSIYEGMH